MLGFKRQSVDDRLDYDIDFARWLSEDDTISDATATADGLDIEAVQVFGQIVKVWVSGGVAGKSYQVDVTATTADGRVKDECFMIRISEC